MRGTIKPSKYVFWKGAWHSWFAWYPTKIELGPRVPNFLRPTQWVWLENVECRKNEYGWPNYDKTFNEGWMYRIHPNNENPCSSNEINSGEGEGGTDV